MMSSAQEPDEDRNDLSHEDQGESEPVQPANTNSSSSSRIPASNIGRNLLLPPKTTTEKPSLVPGLPDEDLWMLIRRFNKQIAHVKATPDAPPEELDLNRAEDDQYPQDKLRITVERFYTSVVVGAVNLWTHIARLRSWKEPRRTSIFCATYFVAWCLDLLVPAIVTVLVALIWCPRLRPLLFPPVPPSVQADSNNTVNTTAGEPELGGDSVTGAPEAHKGEAAEQEARQLVDSLAGVAIDGAPGESDQGAAGAEDNASVELSADTAATTTGAADGDANAESLPADPKAKQPVKKKMSKVTEQTMRVISDTTDIYEKFSNALSPTPPFSATSARLQFVGILTAVGIGSLTPSYWIIKAGAFVIGFGLFGDPVVQRAVELLNEKVPDWRIHMDMQKTLLKGVPSNSQLTLTLLRIGEMNSFPLPPPPNAQEDESSWPIYRQKFRALTRNKDNNNDNDEKQVAPPPAEDTNSTDVTAAPTAPAGPPKPRKGRRFVKVLSFIRRTVAAAIRGHTTLDRAIEIAGSTHTKTLRGMLQSQNLLQIWHMTQGSINHSIGGINGGGNGNAAVLPGSARKFDAKFERKRGALVVDDTRDPPVLYFTTYQSSGLEDLRLDSRKKSSVLFQLPVTEVRELKKTQGLGWKGKLIVELTAGSKEAVEGLIISGSEPEQCYQLTGMRERNQLFNRLAAMGVQFWECC